MPGYTFSGFKPTIQLLYAGVASYFYGSFNQDVSPSQMYVSSVSIVSNVATVAVTVFGGNLPAVGSYISIKGTQVNSAFNVTNALITAASFNNIGVGTVSYALTGANVPVTFDAGLAIVPQPELGEIIVAGASVPVAMSNNSFGGDLDKTVTVACSFPALPSAVTVSLQGALFDQDAQYVTLGTVSTVSAGAITANGYTSSANYLFYRVLVSGLTGSGLLTCKIEA